MNTTTEAPPLSPTVLALIDLGGRATRAEIEMYIMMRGNELTPFEEVSGLDQLRQLPGRAAEWILTPDVLTCAEVGLRLEEAFSKGLDEVSRERALSLAMTHIRDIRVPFGFTYPCRSCYVELLRHEADCRN